MKKHLPLLIIIVVSLIIHFAYFGYPKETVFDEVHFGKFITGYFTHEYFFDIHPPLGKLLLSGMGYIGGFQPGFSFAEIGQKFTDNTYLWLRFLPSLAGALLPIIIYFLALQLGISRLGSFVAGLLIALDNALLVQSRFILLDSFLLLFGFLSLLFYFLYRSKKKLWLLFLTGLFGALAVSVKWTGATFLAIILALELLKIIKNRQYLWPALIQKVVLLVIIPGLVYFGVFAIHLGLLSKSGPGDAFMSPSFQKTLTNNQYTSSGNIQPIGLFKKFIQLNLQMYNSNANLTAGHPYSSQWYTWPFMVRPIYYWTQSGDARIYLLGNPLVWWGSTIAVLYALLGLLFGLVTKIKKDNLLIFLVTGYLLNLLPFIDIKRAMFLYHYMTALIFAVLILVYLIDKLPNKKRYFIVIVSVGLVLFIYFAPLSYGLPITEKAYNARAWFGQWK